MILQNNNDDCYRAGTNHVYERRVTDSPKIESIPHTTFDNPNKFCIENADGKYGWDVLIIIILSYQYSTIKWWIKDKGNWIW